MADSRGPNRALMHSDWVFSGLVRPVTTRECSSSGSSAHSRCSTKGLPSRWPDGISAPCWRCCSCARTSPCRQSGSSISLGGASPSYGDDVAAERRRAAAQAARLRLPPYEADRVPARARRGSARSDAVRAARAGGAVGRAGRASCSAPLGARAVARPTARRPRVGDVRAVRDPSTRGSPARRARGADRGRSRAAARMPSWWPRSRPSSGLTRCTNASAPT